MAGNHYFISDVHLGAAGDADRKSEKAFISFLRNIPSGTEDLYLLGDIFDFWMEIRGEHPQGWEHVFQEFDRLAAIGCKLHFFRGNHDYWMKDYFIRRFDAEIVDEPFIVREIDGRIFCLGHGDSISAVRLRDKLLFKLFRNRLCIAFVRSFPPGWVYTVAHAWASSSRKKNAGKYLFDGRQSPVYEFADRFGEQHKVDYYIFGHLHTPAALKVESGGELYILGDWTEGENYLNLSGMYISGRGLPNIDR